MEEARIRNAEFLVLFRGSEVTGPPLTQIPSRADAYRRYLFRFEGKKMRKGDRVVMWYLSGNRDEEVIPNADEFIIERPKARHHMSLGYGMHRYMGNGLAEMQSRILWEEIQERFKMVEVVGDPVRVRSNFVRGFSDMPVQVHAH